MSYVRKVISNQEKLLCIFRPHWVYVLDGVLWFLALTFAGFVVDHYFYQYVGPDTLFKINFWSVHFGVAFSGIFLIFFVTGIAVFWTFFIIYISSEVGLTDQRVLSKRGLFLIQVDQVDLEDIRAEHVFHGLLGWLLGYGRIRLDCRFIDDVWLPRIPNPYRLVKASHSARLKHPLIEYGHDELQANIQNIETERQEKRKIKTNIALLKQLIKFQFNKTKNRFR